MPPDSRLSIVAIGIGCSCGIDAAVGALRDPAVRFVLPGIDKRDPSLHTGIAIDSQHDPLTIEPERPRDESDGITIFCTGFIDNEYPQRKVF